MHRHLINAKKLQQGFTIIELLVVIVVIGILLALVLSTRAGVNQKERNTERQRDISELRDVIEAYYAQTDKYPTLADINNRDWRKANMKVLDSEVFRDPKDTSGKLQLAAKPAQNIYAYTVAAADGNKCDNQKKPCTQYALTAELEGGTVFVRRNLN